MQKHKLQLSNRPGFTMILALLLITVFIGAAAFAVDFSHAQTRTTAVHAAADAAALAGIEEYAAVGRADSALNEAQAFAAKFKADNTTLTVAPADFTLGFWDTGTSTFTAGGSNINAARAIVRYNGAFAFAPVLNIGSHTTVETSIAIGVPSKSVTQSTCVAPVVMSLGDLLTQLGLPANTTTLTQADVNALLAATAANAVTFDIPNGTKVDALADGEFYQVELPPVLTAAGTTQTGQSPSASEYKNAYTCTGGNAPVGVGDWLAVIPGQDANQTKQGFNNLNGGSYPATIEVILADQFSTTINAVCNPSGSIKGCLHVAFLGAFTATQEPGSKGVTGYFTALDPKAGGVTGTGNSPGPLAIVKTRLVY